MRWFRPTMRDNYRYILAEAVPWNVTLDPKEVYFTISDAITSLFGDAGAASIACVVPYSVGRYVCFRCTRGCEDKVITGLATVHHHAGKPIGFHSVLVSGTIKTIKETVERRMRCSDRYKSYVIDNETEQSGNGNGMQYSDTRNRKNGNEEEKSYKRAYPTFLTRDDTEEYHDE
ncbi:MAG: Rpp14/Pop5 family protein [Methanospirillaceae archaeon]|nr:Rpp14/Pop5 family protein [Methanospirillaceae archaeon]